MTIRKTIAAAAASLIIVGGAGTAVADEIDGAADDVVTDMTSETGEETDGSGSLAGGSSEGSSSEAGSSEGSSLEAGSSEGGSLDAGSSEGGSLDAGSLETEGGSLEGLVPNTDGQACELPGLGGSVEKVYPLLGFDGIPPMLLDLVFGTLDSFPNALEIVGLDSMLGELGSVEGPLCGTVLGGEMVDVDPGDDDSEGDDTEGDDTEGDDTEGDDTEGDDATEGDDETETDTTEGNEGSAMGSLESFSFGS